MELSKRITFLPKEIQNLIGEYNVEHREQTRKICKEFLNIIYIPCKTCKLPYPEDIFYSVDYFIHRKYNIRSYWCSDACFNREENENLKNKYTNSIREYLAIYSIAHSGETLDYYT